MLEEKTDKKILKLTMALLGLSLILILISFWRLHQFKRYMNFIKFPDCLVWSEAQLNEFKPNCFEKTFSNKRWIDLQTNELGLREKSLKDLTQDRILVLGDSTIEGVGLKFEETFSSRLEKKLIENKLNFSVVNAGIRRTSPINQFWKLKSLLPVIKPKLIIWAITENDFNEDHLIFDQALEFDEEGVPLKFNLNYFEKIMPKYLFRLFWSFEKLENDYLSTARFLFSKYYLAKLYEKWGQEPARCEGLHSGLKLARQNNIPVFFISIPFGPKFSPMYKSEGPMKEKLQRLQKCINDQTWIDLEKPELSQVVEFFQEDEMHPNSEGMNKIVSMAEPAIVEFIKKVDK